MTRIVARAPCRVDFAGGTLDIWPLGLLHRGSRTVNVAVDLFQQVTLTVADRDSVVAGGHLVEFETRQAFCDDPHFGLLGKTLEFAEAPPLTVSIESPVPPGSGLGGSSALTVAVLAAALTWRGSPRPEAARLARWARDLEARHMGLPTGLQDHYPALLGGALDIGHEVGGEAVRPLAIALEDLGEHLLVAHTGRSHVSAAQNWRVIRARLEGGLYEEFEEIRAAGAAAAAALAASDFAGLARASSADWAARARFGEGVSTPGIEKALAAAVAAGAWGGKACGAGGGGCVAVLAPGDRRDAVEQALGHAGAAVLRCVPTAVGLSVVESPYA